MEDRLEEAGAPIAAVYPPPPNHPEHDVGSYKINIRSKAKLWNVVSCS